jgi:glycosyltransferase involved in cell wall biosynthesis
METGQRIQGQPLVSIIIPAHNEEKWIASCLESVLRDRYPHKEVIVVDDASTDNTREILKRFPVTVLRDERPVGPSSARNIGVGKARGEIIVFIDAHCIVEDPQWIQKFLQFFRDPLVGAVAGYFRREPTKRGLSLTFRPTTVQQRLIKSANAAYRKTALQQVQGFDSWIEWGGDAALTYKIHRSGWKVVHSRDIMIVHAEKIWSVKKAFFYGTCYFPLLKRYPRETMARSRPIVMGLLLTLGVIADLLYKLPIFTLSLITFLIVLNGAKRNVSARIVLMDGLYTTIWSISYYFGALCGGVRRVLLLGRGSSVRLENNSNGP